MDNTTTDVLTLLLSDPTLANNRGIEEGDLEYENIGHYLNI
jgi:hypothetical protein